MKKLKWYLVLACTASLMTGCGFRIGSFGAYLGAPVCYDDGPAYYHWNGGWYENVYYYPGDYPRGHILYIHHTIHRGGWHYR